MRLLEAAALVFLFGLASCPNSSNVLADETDSVQLVRQAVFAIPGTGVAEVSTEELE